MSWNYDKHLMCDRCGKMPLAKTERSLAWQLAWARAHGWQIVNLGTDEQLHFCPECGSPPKSITPN